MNFLKNHYVAHEKLLKSFQYFSRTLYTCCSWKLTKDSSAASKATSKSVQHSWNQGCGKPLNEVIFSVSATDLKEGVEQLYKSFVLLTLEPFSDPRKVICLEDLVTIEEPFNTVDIFKCANQTQRSHGRSETKITKVMP